MNIISLIAIGLLPDKDGSASALVYGISGQGAGLDKLTKSGKLVRNKIRSKN